MNGNLAAEMLSSSAFRGDILEEISRQGSPFVEAWKPTTEPGPIYTSCLLDTTQREQLSK